MFFHKKRQIEYNTAPKFCRARLPRNHTQHREICHESEKKPGDGLYVLEPGKWSKWIGRPGESTSKPGDFRCNRESWKVCIFIILLCTDSLSFILMWSLFMLAIVTLLIIGFYWNKSQVFQYHRRYFNTIENQFFNRCFLRCNKVTYRDVLKLFYKNWCTGRSQHVTFTTFLISILIVSDILLLFFL